MKGMYGLYGVKGTPVLGVCSDSLSGRRSSTVVWMPWDMSGASFWYARKGSCEVGVMVGERATLIFGGGGGAMVRLGLLPRWGAGCGSGMRRFWARWISAGSVGEYGVEGEVGWGGGRRPGVWVEAGRQWCAGFVVGWCSAVVLDGAADAEVLEVETSGFFLPACAGETRETAGFREDGAW